MARFTQAPNSPSDDINILLLGETGVGKTTFINAFINSLFYNTLDDALQNELKVLIPSSFTITNPETYQSDKITIGIPNDNEDNDADGASSTKACRSYVFRFANRCITID